MTPTLQKSMIALQICHYPSTTYIEQPAWGLHLTIGTACLEFVISSSSLEAALALTRQSLEVPRMVEVRAQERNVTD
jgi:hypothetical protein